MLKNQTVCVGPLNLILGGAPIFLRKDMITSNGYRNAWYTGSLDLANGTIDAIWHDYIIACLENTGFCKDAPADFRQKGSAVSQKAL